jgi:hypothetical protein
MATATERYKVGRAFQRWEGKALRKYARGHIIPPKDAVKIKSLGTLIAAGAVYRLPDGDDTELTKNISVGPIRDHGALDLVTVGGEIDART